MYWKRRIGRSAVLGLLLLSAAAETAFASGQWLQWGGPNRNFMVEATGLADEWPADGPKKLWHRELGDGYSSILAEGDTLYTMYTAGKAEVTIALDARSGRTIWEHRNPDGFTGTEYGPGPHATPLLVGDRLFTIGAKAMLHCLDRHTGKVIWKHDLISDYAAPLPHFGYSPSPLAYENLIIVPVDRDRSRGGGDEGAGASKDSDGQSIMAFDQETGKLVWQSQDYPIDYSSPALINFAGEDQLVLFMRREVIAVAPRTGKLLWHLECLPSPEENIATPLWTGDDLIFLSAAYASGSRVIKLTRENGRTVPKQVWYDRKLRVHHGNAIRVGDYVYGSSGDFGTTLFVAVDIHTGEVAWRERGLRKATCVYADGKVIALEEHGRLVLATLSPEGLKIHSHCMVSEHESWTPPTLAGTKLFIRDRKNIMAFDLG